MANQQNTAEEHVASQVMEVELPNAADRSGQDNLSNIDMLLDMTLPITVSLGTGEVPIGKLLQLGPGSVLQLDRRLGEPADLYIRDTMIATGDIVVVDDRLAIRIRQVTGNAH